MRETITGTNPDIEGYDPWLTQVSYLYDKRRPHNPDFRTGQQNMSWHATPWLMYFNQGLTPQQALDAGNNIYRQRIITIREAKQNYTAAP